MRRCMSSRPSCSSRALALLAAVSDRSTPCVSVSSVVFSWAAVMVLPRPFGLLLPTSGQSRPSRDLFPVPLFSMVTHPARGPLLQPPLCGHVLRELRQRAAGVGERRLGRPDVLGDRVGLLHPGGRGAAAA